MTKSELNINDHIRRLTYDLSQEEKIKSLDSILATGQINDKTVSAVLISLDDKSESDAFRKHGIKVIHSMLGNATLPEQKDCIMRHLMTRIFGRYYDETVIGHKELFKTLVHTIERNIDDMDHLFVWLMQEVNKVQEINYNSTNLPFQVAKFFETEHQKDNLRSKRVFRDISNERHLLTLFDNTTPLNTVTSTLELLGERNLADINFDLIAAHLSPVLNFKHKSAKEVVRLALTNIENWAKEFPQGVEEIHDQRVNIHNWLHHPDEHSLDDATLKQLGMNTIFVPELVASLTKKRRTICDTKQLLKVLSYFNSIRTGSRIEEICDFILDVKHEIPKNNFPYISAIDFLQSQITGLDIHQPSSSESENESQEEQYRKKLLIERNLRADKNIKDALLSLSQNINLSHEIRARAWSVIISAMPFDLLEILHNNIEDLKSNNYLLNSTLKDLSNIHSIETYSILESLWNERKQFDLSTNKQIAVTLGAIGHYDIAPLLLPTVFDDENMELRQVAKEVLTNEGYAAEIEKETHRRKMLALHAQEKEVSNGILKAEEKIKTLYQEIRKSQAEYSEVSQHYSITVNELDTFTIRKKMELADTAIDLAKVKGKIRVLLKKIGELESEIRELTNRLNNKVSEADNVLSQVRQVESSITRKDQELRTARRNLLEARDTLVRLRNEERASSSNLSNLESDLNAANRRLSPIQSRLHSSNNELTNIDGKIRRLENQARRESTDNSSNFNRYSSQISNLKSRRNSIQRQSSQISDELSQQNRKVNQLKRLVSSESSKLSNLRNQIRNTNNKIQKYQNIIPRLENDIIQLQKQHKSLEKRIHEINRDIGAYRNNISKHTTNVNQLKVEINQLQRELNAIIHSQKVISDSSKTGIQQRTSEVQNLHAKANKLTIRIKRLHQDFTNTENSLQNFKTEKQSLIQQMEFEREHYDELGDKCNIASNIANARNENRSKGKKVQNRGNDEIRLSKDKIIERSSSAFTERVPETKKIRNKIQK